MSKPDRHLLDQINTAWDERIQQRSDGKSNADGYAEIIDALHQADHDSHPRVAFRRRLREELLAKPAPGPASAGSDAELNELAGNQVSHPTPLRRRGNGENDMERRRWWFSHAGELAAMILILVMVGAGVAWWQSGDDSPLLPGATGGDTDDQIEVIPTPQPAESGVWTGLTFDEAQAITPFRLVMPESLPDGSELAEISVRDLTRMAEAENHHLGTREDGDPWVTVVFEFASSDDGSMIELAQQNLRSPDMPVQAGQPDSVTGTDDHPGPASEVAFGELAIDGINVKRTIFQEMRGRERAMYSWFQDGLTMHLAVPHERELPDDDDIRSRPADSPDAALMEMIESIITQRVSDDEPPIIDEFGIAPEDEAVAVEEDPAAVQPDYHRDLSWDEAQAIVPYDLIDPRDTHERWELGGVSVTEPPMGDNFHVGFVMMHTEVSGRSFQIFQQNSRLATPAISEDVQAVHPDADPIDEVETPDPVKEEIQIDGLLVTHTVQYNLGGDQNTTYTWYQDGTGVAIYALTEVHEKNINDINPDHAVPGDDLAEIVRAIIESRFSDEEPPEPDVGEPPADTPPPLDGGRQELSFAEAEERSPFPLFDIEQLPGMLRFLSAELIRAENGQPVERDHPDIDDPNRVTLYFGTSPDSEPQQIMQIVQTTDMIPNEPGEMIEVEGRPVEVVSGQMGTSFEHGWIWEVDGMEYGILITTITRDNLDLPDEFETAPLISEDDVLDMIAGTLE